MGGYRIVVVACVLAMGASASPALTTVVTENWNASTVGWSYNGSAAPAAGQLVLTDTLPNQCGSAFFTTALPSSRFVADFSFRMAGTTGADGLTFSVQPVSAQALGGLGHNLGYGASGLVIGATHTLSPSLAVEFDTYDNSQWGWPESSNHVGVNLNGDMASVLSSSAIPALANNGTFRTLIDFDNGHISVALGRPDGPLTTVLDADVTGYSDFGPAFFGFTGGTGTYADLHAVDDFTLAVPEPSSLALLALAGLFAVRRNSANSDPTL